MEKLFAWLDRRLIPIMTKLSEQRHLRAVRDGIISTIPLIIVGSFFLIVAFPPVPALAAAVKPYTAQILLPFRLTMGLMALYATHSIGYHLAKSYKLDGVAGGTMALAAFLLTSLPVTIEGKGLALLMENLGGGGMFVAIIMAIVAVEILRFAKEKKITIRMPEGVPDSVARSFEPSSRPAYHPPRLGVRHLPASTSTTPSTNCSPRSSPPATPSPASSYQSSSSPSCGPPASTATRSSVPSPGPCGSSSSTRTSPPPPPASPSPTSPPSPSFSGSSG
jgi:hypothetical protein